MSLQTQQVITYLDISEDKTTGHAMHHCATHFVFTVTLRTHNTISHNYFYTKAQVHGEKLKIKIINKNSYCDRRETI